MLLRSAQPTAYDVPAADVPAADVPAAPALLQAGATLQADTAAAAGAADSSAIATLEGIPEQEPTGLDRLMLAEDRLPVVLAVVLVVWVGVLLMLARTDRRLRRLERELDGDA